MFCGTWLCFIFVKVFFFLNLIWVCILCLINIFCRSDSALAILAVFPHLHLNLWTHCECLTVEWTWSNFTGKAQSYFCDGPLILFCPYTSGSIFAVFLFLSLFFWHITPLPKMSHHKNSWKDKVGTSFRSFLIVFSGDILEEKCRWRSVRPCLLLRMAGCTSRCRQGVLKLIQSLQRLVSGTLAKGTLSL